MKYNNLARCMYIYLHERWKMATASREHGWVNIVPNHGNIWDLDSLEGVLNYASKKIHWILRLHNMNSSMNHSSLLSPLMTCYTKQLYKPCHVCLSLWLRWLEIGGSNRPSILSVPRLGKLWCITYLRWAQKTSDTWGEIISRIHVQGHL